MDTWGKDPIPPRVGNAARARGLGALVTTVAAVQLTWPRILVGTLAWLGALLMALQVFQVFIAGAEPVLPITLELLFVGLLVTSRCAGPRTTLYLFHGGAVVDHPRRPTAEAFGWPDLTTGESYRLIPGSDPRRRALLVRAAGRPVFFCLGDARARLLDALSAMEPARTRAWVDGARPAGRF